MPVQKRRSNRLLTDQAIRAVRTCLNDMRQSEWEIGSNTKVEVLGPSIIVSLCGNPIVEITKAAEAVEKVTIFAGNYYDKEGNPTYLTMERVNGLLDYLGSKEIIPQPVRMYKDPDEQMCYLTFQKRKKIVFNKHYSTRVELKSDPSEFIVLSEN